MGRFLSKSRAGIATLAIGAGIAGSLAMAPASMAAAPQAGTACQSNDGKISGRGSTLQLWLVYDLMGQYTQDVCGPVASQGSNDVSDPSDPSLATGITFAQNWMLAYDYPNAQTVSGTGSGQGQSAMTCRSDAFGGTDVPESKAQLTTMDGVPGSCITGIAPPFSPAASPITSTYPNAGDTEPTGGRGNASNSLMTMPIGASAVAIAAYLPASCIASGNTAANQPFALTTADMENIWGGLYTTWDQLVAADPNTGLAAGCTGSLTRVVREDNSGTTQGFDNYLTQVGGSTPTCDSTNSFVSTLGALAGNQVTAGTNQLWPGGPTTKAAVPPAGTAFNYNVAGCSHLISATKSGANALIDQLNVTPNGIGYADISDTVHDPSLSTGTDNLTIATVLGADGTQQSPQGTSGSFASNCTFTGASLPSGGASAAVGLVNLTLASPGGWLLGAGGKDDITYSHQVGGYPICSLTWDMTWAGEDGNTPSTPTSSTAVSAPAGAVVDVSSLAGLNNSGSFKDGTSSFTYTGLGTSTGTCGGTSTACVTGVSGSGSIASGDTLSWPVGTGGPLANLTADQRRTLYSYFLWLYSPEGQSSENAAGYAPLPTLWQSTILTGFKASF